MDFDSGVGSRGSRFFSAIGVALVFGIVSVATVVLCMTTQLSHGSPGAALRPGHGFVGSSGVSPKVIQFGAQVALFLVGIPTFVVSFFVWLIVAPARRRRRMTWAGVSGGLAGAISVVVLVATSVDHQAEKAVRRNGDEYYDAFREALRSVNLGPLCYFVVGAVLLGILLSGLRLRSAQKPT
jgi:hypothetical protein